MTARSGRHGPYFTCNRAPTCRGKLEGDGAPRTAVSIPPPPPMGTPNGAQPVVGVRVPEIVLDEYQEAVAQWRRGWAVVAAAAGSGKSTSVLVRTVRLLAEGEVPEGILLLVYNTAAADLLRRRLSDFVGPAAANRVGVYTVHAWANALLRNWYAHDARFAIGHLIGGRDGPNAVKIAIPVADALRKQENIDISFGAGLRAYERWAETLTALSPESVASSMNWPVDNRASDAAAFIAAYQEYKRKHDLMDFTDMLCDVARAVQYQQGQRHVDYLKTMYRHVVVDEAQDQSLPRAVIAQWLGQGAQSFLAVGDLRQCIPQGQLVLAAGGWIPIETVTPGDIVYSLSAGAFTQAKVLATSSVEKPGFFRFTLDSGYVFCATPDHVCFASLDDPKGTYVYLMYRRDLGFRVGVSRTVGFNGEYFRVRTVQEHADRLWILAWFETYGEGAEMEAQIAYRYGIPREPFKPRAGMWSDSAEATSRLFAAFGKNGWNLIRDLGLDFDRPSYFPKSTAGDRVAVNLGMGTKEGAQVSVETANLPESYDTARRGWKKSKKGTYRLRRYFHNYADARKLAEELVEELREFSAYLVEGMWGTGSARRMLAVRAQTVFPGMMVPVVDPGGSGGATVARVTKREYVEKAGTCYDLEVERHANFLVGGVVVHNSVNGFAGAKPRLFLNLAHAPGVTLLTLPVNRRSSRRVVEAANEIARGQEWNLGGDTVARPGAPEGEPVQVWDTENAQAEASRVISDIQRRVSHGRPVEVDGHPSYVCVARTNAWLVQMEYSFVARGIPVRVAGSTGGIWGSGIGQEMLAYLEGIEGVPSFRLLNVLNKPKRFAKKSDLGAVLEKAAEREKAGKRADLHIALSASPSAPINRFGRDLATAAKLPWVRRCRRVAEWLGVDEDDDDGGDGGEDRRAALTALLALAQQLESLAGVYDYQQKMLQGERDPAVRLATIHSMKGSEAPVVYVCGVCVDKLPHRKSVEEGEEAIDEELRLFYVAVTRARDVCIVSSGGTPSRFLVDTGWVRDPLRPRVE